MNRLEKITYEVAKLGTIIMNEGIKNKDIHKYYASMDIDKMKQDKDYGKIFMDDMIKFIRIAENLKFLKEIRHLYIVEFEINKPSIFEN